MINHLHCVSSNDEEGQHHTALRIMPFTMSFEGSNKRSVVSMSSGGDGKRLRIPNDNAEDDSIAGFDNVPTECNVSILQFLDVDDLANAAQVSHRFHKNSLHPSLPQNRTATLTCVRRLDESTGTLSASPFLLLQKLIGKGEFDQYGRFNKVKIIGHNLLENVSIPEVRGMLPGSVGRLHHVRVLDLSFPSNSLKKDTKLKVCIPALLSFIMPCLREIDLSNVRVRASALRYLAYACPALEKVTWNRHHHHRNAGISMEGPTLNACRCLKEIYMNDSIFFYMYYNESNAIQIEGRDSHLFSRCNTFLERVSLKNAKYDFEKPTQSFPQFGLVKFVRGTPSLRWFRSDLSPENVAMLQAERPEVTFA
jgi:hypothetical protein